MCLVNCTLNHGIKLSMFAKVTCSRMSMILLESQCNLYSYKTYRSAVKPSQLTERKDSSHAPKGSFKNSRMPIITTIEMITIVKPRCPRGVG